MSSHDSHDRKGEVTLSSLVGSFMSGEALERASENRRAGVAWYRANGDTERRHTTGVFVRDDERRGRTLCVYVDSNAVMVEFNAMRQMYVARLRAQGLEVDAIQFLLSREGYDTWMGKREHVQKELPPDLPELSEEEEREIQELMSTDLPAALKDSVERAVRLSYRREKEIRSTSSNGITDKETKQP